MFGDLSDQVTKSIEESSAKATEMVQSIEKNIDEFKKSTEAKFEELDKQYAELNKGLEAAKSEGAEVQKSLEAIVGGTAIQKSEDVEDKASDEETSENDSIFKGTFLPLDGLKK
jgi:seryl-tRNA synthetase